jgi:hypothetical protein
VKPGPSGEGRAASYSRPDRITPVGYIPSTRSQPQGPLGISDPYISEKDPNAPGEGYTDVGMPHSAGDRRMCVGPGIGDNNEWKSAWFFRGVIKINTEAYMGVCLGRPVYLLAGIEAPKERPTQLKGAVKNGQELNKNKTTE